MQELKMPRLSTPATAPCCVRFAATAEPVDWERAPPDTTATASARLADPAVSSLTAIPDLTTGNLAAQSSVQPRAATRTRVQLCRLVRVARHWTLLAVFLPFAPTHLRTSVHVSVPLLDLTASARTSAPCAECVVLMRVCLGMPIPASALSAFPAAPSAPHPRQIL